MAGLEDLNTNAVIADAALAVAPSGKDAMTLWSDEKKKDFCKTFEDRSRVAAYILVATANELIDTAMRRQFVGNAGQKLKAEYHSKINVQRDQVDNGNYKYDGDTVGGRKISELSSIADGRAEEIFKNLPPLRQAVQLVKPHVAKKLDALDVLKAEVKKYTEKLDAPALSGEIRLSQVDQKMTIGEFRKAVKERTKLRKSLVEKLNEVAKEAHELEDEIAKDLYAGIPELQGVILDVARKHFERAMGMGSMTRRVQEHVQFGDSRAAVDMVKQFEHDEQAVAPDIKSEFDAALDKLKLSASTVRKALAGKKEKKA